MCVCVWAGQPEFSNTYIPLLYKYDFLNAVMLCEVRLNLKDSYFLQSVTIIVLQCRREMVIHFS